MLARLKQVVAANVNATVEYYAVHVNGLQDINRRVRHMTSRRSIRNGVSIFQASISMSGYFRERRICSFPANSAKAVRLNTIQGQGHLYHVAYSYRMLDKVKELFY